MTNRASCYIFSTTCIYCMASWRRSSTGDGGPAVAGAVQNAVGKVLVSASMTVLLPAPTIHSPHRSILFLVCQGPTSLNLQINTFSCYLVTHY